MKTNGSDIIFYGRKICSEIAGAPGGRDREILRRLSGAKGRPIKLSCFTSSNKEEGVVDYNLLLTNGKLQIQRASDSGRRVVYEGFSFEEVSLVMNKELALECDGQRYISPERMRQDVLEHLAKKKQ